MEYPTLYIVRDIYGNVAGCGWDKQTAYDKAAASMQPGAAWNPVKHRTVRSTKDLALALLQLGASKACRDAAWRMAVKQGGVEPSKSMAYDPKHKDMDQQTIEYGQQESEQVDYFIGIMVNDPESKFYIHG